MLQRLYRFLAGGSPAIGQQPATDLPINQMTSYKGEEFLLIGNANRGAGEPVIAINPKNPNNIIVGGMANLHYVEGEPLGIGQERVQRRIHGSSIATHREPRSPCTRSATTVGERGHTWRIHSATILR